MLTVLPGLLYLSAILLFQHLPPVSFSFFFLVGWVKRRRWWHDANSNATHGEYRLDHRSLPSWRQNLKQEIATLGCGSGGCKIGTVEFFSYRDKERWLSFQSTDPLIYWGEEESIKCSWIFRDKMSLFWHCLLSVCVCLCFYLLACLCYFLLPHSFFLSVSHSHIYSIFLFFLSSMRFLILILFPVSFLH